MGWCAAHDEEGKRRKGRDEHWYKSVNGRWKKNKSSKRRTSPKMDNKDPMWTNLEYIERLDLIKNLMIDDKINERYYNLSGYVGDKEVRFAYIYPNRFETNDDGIRYTFDSPFVEKMEVPHGTDIWVHISNQMDKIGVPYEFGKDFIFESFEDDAPLMA